MSILEKFSKKKNSNANVVETKEHSDVVQLAQNASDLISSGIKNRDLETANRNLDHLAENEKREICVFYPEKDVFYRIVLVVTIPILLVGAWVMFVSGQTAFFSGEFRTIGISLSAVSLALILWGIARIIFCIKHARFLIRYKKYYQLMKFKRLILTEELSNYAKVTDDIVIKDINKAIRLNYIPQGYFSNNNMFLITSNDVYRDYQSNTAAYDQYMTKKLDEYRRQTERPAVIQRYLDEGKNYIEKIHQDNVVINDKGISDQLDRMENTVSFIFEELDMNPQNADELSMLLQYYLPTTEKLLQNYIQVSGAKYQSEGALKIKKDIAHSIENTNYAYERILGQMFKQREIDISSDVAAMSAMMNQEGLLNGSGAEESVDRN